MALNWIFHLGAWTGYVQTVAIVCPYCPKQSFRETWSGTSRTVYMVTTAYYRHPQHHHSHRTEKPLLEIVVKQTDLIAHPDVIVTAMTLISELAMGK
mmetsp:Transcript_15489/g.31417  ORF Transcript_15489/g.31417 Transcript_15489/m.31417 type:complete len:97 (-) Transcript_15489:322-612(-)